MWHESFELDTTIVTPVGPNPEYVLKQPVDYASTASPSSSMGRVIGHCAGEESCGFEAMPRRLHHRAAACTDATIRPRRGHHRTIFRISSNGRARDNHTAHRWATLLDTNALRSHSRVPFLPLTSRAAILSLSWFKGRVKPCLSNALTVEVDGHAQLFDPSIHAV